MSTTRCTPRQDETVAVPVLAATTSSTPRRLRTRRLHAKSSDACKKWGDETPHLRTDSARVRSTPRALHRRSQKPRKTRYTDDSVHDDSVRSPTTSTTPRRLRARRLHAESSDACKNWGDETPHLRTDSARVRSTPRELHQRSQKPRKNRATTTPCTTTPGGVLRNPLKMGRGDVPLRTDSARLRENSAADHKNLAKTHIVKGWWRAESGGVLRPMSRRPVNHGVFCQLSRFKNTMLFKKGVSERRASGVRPITDSLRF